MIDQRRRRTTGKLIDLTLHHRHTLFFRIEVVLAADGPDHSKLLRSNHVGDRFGDRVRRELRHLRFCSICRRSSFITFKSIEFLLIKVSCDTEFDRRSLQGIMLWVWHAPSLFNAALLSESWHVAQHLCLFGSALLFWWSMSRVSSLDQRHGLAAFWLFFTSLHSGLLGALMSFSESPWYPKYAALALAGAGGLTPLQDQQLAGLIMWIPGGAFHAIVALVYLNRWFQVPWHGAQAGGRSV